MDNDFDRYDDLLNGIEGDAAQEHDDRLEAEWLYAEAQAEQEAEMLQESWGEWD